MGKTIRQPKKIGSGLDMAYGLGVGFDASTVLSPFTQAIPPSVSMMGDSGKAERCADLSGDRIHRKTVARLKREFEGRDPVSDWLRTSVSSGTIVHFRDDQPDNFPVHLDVVFGSGSASRLLVVAEPNSRGTVIVRCQGTGRMSSLIEVFVGENAQINLVRIQDTADSHDHGRLQASLCDGSELNLSECLFGGNYTASWSEVLLSGERSRAGSRTLTVGTGQEKFDLRCVMRHSASGSVSRISTANVLLDRSKIIDRGLIEVDRGAEGCSGVQKADTILLSHGADYVSQPHLEVNEDDARCRHATAIGQLDSESLFYLMSRGLNETEARRRLVEGFANPILSEMKEVGLDEMVNCLIARRF